MDLLQTPLFHGMTRDTLETLLHSTATRRKKYQREEIIFRTGDLIRELGVVLRGSVCIETIDFLGSRSILSQAQPGDVFGETYAFCHTPMMVDAVAAEESEILFLRLDTLSAPETEQAEWVSRLRNNLMGIFAGKNLMLSQRIFCTSAKTIRGRLLTYLSGQAVRAGSSRFTIPFDRQQLADYLNLDRSALSKELGKMRRDGLIEYRKDHFTLYAERFPEEL